VQGEQCSSGRTAQAAAVAAFGTGARLHSATSSIAERAAAPGGLVWPADLLPPTITIAARRDHSSPPLPCAQGATHTVLVLLAACLLLQQPLLVQAQLPVCTTIKPTCPATIQEAMARARGVVLPPPSPASVLAAAREFALAPRPLQAMVAWWTSQQDVAGLAQVPQRVLPALGAEQATPVAQQRAQTAHLKQIIVAAASSSSRQAGGGSHARKLQQAQPKVATPSPKAAAVRPGSKPAATAAAKASPKAAGVRPASKTTVTAAAKAAAKAAAAPQTRQAGRPAAAAPKAAAALKPQPPAPRPPSPKQAAARTPPARPPPKAPASAREAAVLPFRLIGSPAPAPKKPSPQPVRPSPVPAPKPSPAAAATPSPAPARQPPPATPSTPPAALPPSPAAPRSPAVPPTVTAAVPPSPAVSPAVSPSPPAVSPAVSPSPPAASPAVLPPGWSSSLTYITSPRGMTVGVATTPHRATGEGGGRRGARGAGGGGGGGELPPLTCPARGCLTHPQRWRWPAGGSEPGAGGHHLARFHALRAWPVEGRQPAQHLGLRAPAAAILLRMHGWQLLGAPGAM